MKRNIALFLVLLTLITLFAACDASHLPPNLSTYKSSAKSGSSTANIIRPDSPKDAKPEQVEPEEFVVIQLGMSYEDVCAIIGGEGKGKAQGKFMFYTWEGYGALGNQVTMAFKDGILTNKDPQGKNARDTASMPSLEDAEAYLKARNPDQAELIDEAQESADEKAEELGLAGSGAASDAPAEPEAPAEEAAPEG